MINRLDAGAEGFADALARLRRIPEADDIQDAVAAIIRQVRENGDSALLKFSAEFDDFRPKNAAGLHIPKKMLAAARETISPPVLSALRDAAARVREYHRRQKPRSWQRADLHGNIVGERFAPVSRAAVYAPGGRAAYPSSVLMGVIPAKVAGVAEVLLMTPAAGGAVSPLSLAAAAEAGADEVLICGGAQAIAAAAFGTESVRRADVVAGPGNAFVAEAKRQLCGHIGVDSLAGPSEVLIISDDSASPEWVAADMIAQAEHDSLAQSIVVSPVRRHLDEVAAALQKQISAQPRAAIVSESLAKRGALILAPDLDECIRIADEIAAEHLQIMCADADTVAARVRTAGGIFIGAHSPTVFGDYGAGPNHILPTGGTARFASPLSTVHFMKRTGVLRANPEGAAVLAESAAVLAESEGLFAHAAAARLRGTKKSVKSAPKSPVRE